MYAFTNQFGAFRLFSIVATTIKITTTIEIIISIVVETKFQT